MPEEAGEQSTEKRGGAEQFPDRFQRESTGKQGRVKIEEKIVFYC